MLTKNSILKIGLYTNSFISWVSLVRSRIAKMIVYSILTFFLIIKYKRKEITSMKLKKSAIRVVAKTLTAVAFVFATMPCIGRLYEPEVPDCLRQ